MNYELFTLNLKNKEIQIKQTILHLNEIQYQIELTQILFLQELDKMKYKFRSYSEIRKELKKMETDVKTDFEVMETQ